MADIHLILEITGRGYTAVKEVWMYWLLHETNSQKIGMVLKLLDCGRVVESYISLFKRARGPAALFFNQ